jgi:hypothetical protein
MPSKSLIRWNGERCRALDEIENAHLRIGGSKRGRRHATQQINYAYTTLLSSNFQGFCRDLHSECVDHIVKLTPANLKPFMRSEFVWNRSLDRGNPHPSGIGSDFNRIGVNLWAAVYRFNKRNWRRRDLLQGLVDWRNAIAHQDFTVVAPSGSPVLHLSHVRGWRRAVSALADNFDRAMYNYLRGLIGSPPW